MRIVIQRVKSSRLEVNNEVISEIGVGFNVFVGVAIGDTMENVKKVAKRIASIRLFENELGKLAKNVCDVGGEVLLVSNFTLCDKKGAGGTRPDFTLSADKETANHLYQELQKELINTYNLPTKMGKFAEDMHIYTHLDGPVNIFQEY